MKKFFKCLLLLLLSLNLFSCTTVKRYITYTVYPIGYLLDRIGQGKVETITLQSNEMIQTATIVDNYQEILDDTSYFFHIGDLEPYLDLYKEEVEASEANIVDLSVLNAIYNNGNSVIFSSNYSIPELAESFSLDKAIIERINEMATRVIKLEGDDFRDKILKEKSNKAKKLGI